MKWLWHLLFHRLTWVRGEGDWELVYCRRCDYEFWRPRSGA